MRGTAVMAQSGQDFGIDPLGLGVYRPAVARAGEACRPGAMSSGNRASAGSTAT